MQMKQKLLQMRIEWRSARLWVFLLALFLRLTWAWLAPHYDPFLVKDPLLGDARAYHGIATNLAAGFGYVSVPGQPDSFWPPLYPIFLSGVIKLFGNSLQLIRYINAILSALSVLFFYNMARRLVDRNTALIIGLGSALYPHWIYFGTWIIAESLLFFLLGLAMWLLAVFHTRRNISILAVVGVLLGLSALAKPTVLFFTAFIVAWLFFAPERISIARRVANVAVLGVCVGLVIFPWTLRNYQVNGQLVLISTNGGYTFYGVNNPYAWGGHDEGFPVFDPKLNSAQNEDVFYQRAFEWIRSNPGEFMKLLPIKYSRLLSPLSVGSWKQDFPIPGSFFIYPIYYLYLIVAFCGMVLLIPRWRKFGFLYAPVLGVMASTGLFYGHARFTLPMAPALVFFTAAFILSAWQWISKILIRRTQSTP